MCGKQIQGELELIEKIKVCQKENIILKERVEKEAKFILLLYQAIIELNKIEENLN